MENLEARTISKVTVRLIPLLIVCFFISYLDRVNVAFAATTMNSDLGFTASVYGLGVGIFFIGYFFFEVPSNLFLERFGARKWIARIMFTWGVLSASMALVRGETSFYTVRLLLGIAEAGFFPGVIFLLTLWFPAVYRARIIGYFLIALPLATVIGAPLSGLLLGLDGVYGLSGWQWLFITEAMPALIMSVFVFSFLTDKPGDATWLEPKEKDWLQGRMEQERSHRESLRNYSVRQALWNPKVVALSITYFGVVATNYGIGFFLPQIVKDFGLSNFKTGIVSALPYVAGIAGTIFWSRRSDRKGERSLHTALPLFIAVSGIAISTAFDDPTMKMAALCVAGFGTFGCLPVFWTLPTAFLSGAAAAGGIALINSIGNLAGFAGPSAMGLLKDQTGSYTDGLLSVSGAGLVAVIIVLVLGHDRSLDTIPAKQAA